MSLSKLTNPYHTQETPEKSFLLAVHQIQFPRPQEHFTPLGPVTAELSKVLSICGDGEVQVNSVHL